MLASELPSSQVPCSLALAVGSESMVRVLQSMMILKALHASADARWSYEHAQYSTF